MIHFIHRIRTLFITIAIIANMIGTGVLFILVAIMNSDVIARGIFHAPIGGVVEMVIFSLILIVFLQLPDVVNSGRLTRSDGLLSILQVRTPKAANLLSRIIDFIAAIFMTMIAYTIWPEFVESFETCQFFEAAPTAGTSMLEHLSTALARCHYFGTPGIFTAPWWPARLVIFFGVSLAAIVFMFNVLPKPEDAD